VCPEVRCLHEETEDGSAMEAVFKCLFQPVPGNIEYDVDWYIDGTLVNNAKFYGVSYNNINEIALRPRHWVSNFTMSFQVCMIKPVFIHLVVSECANAAIKLFFKNFIYWGYLQLIEERYI
jgi:hypothetical protein